MKDTHREAVSGANDLLKEISDYFMRENIKINEAIFVPFTIFFKILSNHSASLKLLDDGYLSESAIIALSQFESRLDLAYVSVNSENSTKWINHNDNKWPMLSVKRKIKYLYDGNNDMYSIIEGVHTKLSGIKHGNSFYSELSFPVRMNDNKIIISTVDFGDEFSLSFSKSPSGKFTFSCIGVGA